MYDGGKVVFGLALFVALCTSPLWLSVARGGGGAEAPPLQMPAPAAGKCVRDGEWMRNSHMELLNSWRDEVVREGKRSEQLADGRVIEKSLTKTCLGCHTDKTQFCDRCHDYVGVKPFCFDCHVETAGG
ncbi:MAG: sulfate reduction electron transfer complex DsrMKJOP subunit DsrJ [Planctomycetes bacterium]|nr:sulfate reduction electron transfer complex DsrMKJOP subunit DsrJ [Planctomycetota bacterium]